MPISQAEEFIRSNSMVIRVEDLPKGVIVEPIDSKYGLRIAIMLDEDTTGNQIRNVIPLALEWRDRLMEWKGISQSGGDNLFLIQLDCRQKGGQTYAEIADGINSTIAKYLKLYADFEKEQQAASPHFKTQWDYHEWLFDKAANPGLRNPPEEDAEDNPSRLAKSVALFHAGNLLEAIRYQEPERGMGKKRKSRRPTQLKKQDIDQILRNGLERIARGQEPFEKGYPVDGSRVLATLRSWRGSKKYKIFKSKEIESE